MPARARSSSKPSAATRSEAIQEEFDSAAILAAGPKLVPYQSLRIGRRKVFLGLMESWMPKGPDGKPVHAKAGSKAALPEMTTAEVLDMLDEMDRALESVAEDPAEYVAWATGDDLEEKLTKLFRAYVVDLGNSTGSAN